MHNQISKGFVENKEHKIYFVKFSYNNNKSQVGQFYTDRKLCGNEKVNTSDKSLIIMRSRTAASTTKIVPM